MSGLDLSQHSLNTSATKQKYSFPRSRRFRQHQSKPVCESIYELPSTFARRTTTLGYGTKTMGILNTSFIPGPGNYNLQSDFNPQKNKLHSASFGIGRQSMELGGPLGQVKFLQKLPPPGAYNIKDMRDNRAPSLKSRLPDHQFQKSTKNPGPGTYNQANMGTGTYYITSKYKNFTNGKMSQVARLDPISNRKPSVGPAQYEVVDGLNKIGRYSLAKHSSASSCVFSKSQRKGLVQKNIVYNPGPGQQYQQFYAVNLSPVSDDSFLMISTILNFDFQQFFNQHFFKKMIYRRWLLIEIICSYNYSFQRRLIVTYKWFNSKLQLKAMTTLLLQQFLSYCLLIDLLVKIYQ